jgi:uncharacterized protein (DUF885 family)
VARTKTRWIAATALLAAVLGMLGMPAGAADPGAAANAGNPVASSAVPNAQTAKARALFDEYWEWTMRESPSYATAVGDHRYDDRLRDESAAAVRKRRAMLVDFRDRLAKIDAGALSDADRVSLRVLRHGVEEGTARNALFGDLPFGARDGWSPVTQQDGPQFGLTWIVNNMRFASVRDYDNYLSRLEAWPTSIDQLIARMEAAIKSGWMPSKVAIARVPSQLDAQLTADPVQTLAYKPFRSFPPDIPEADRKRLAEAGLRAIKDQVNPAFARLRDFYTSRYLPAASDKIAASDLPGGAAYYAAMLRASTTTGMSAQEIHALGLAEVARIGKEMDAVVTAVGFKGTRAQFQEFATTDPQFLFADPDAMLAAYRDIAKRADAQLPGLFAELPRLPYGVRAMRPEEGDNAEHYSSGSAASGRPGYFDANVNNMKRRPKWSMETLLLHEAVPGHHLQIARAQELTDLPPFRRHGGVTAFSEGWALYAESLGYEMGFYADPYTRFGNLTGEMHRAARLVVDTGIHAFGWTREQAIAYLQENAALTPAFATAEVDRYIVWPGQATAYKVGELKIKALRAKAKAQLREKFDLRRFHNAVIDNGSVPLDVLEAQIDDWIASEKTRP